VAAVSVSTEFVLVEFGLNDAVKPGGRVETTDN
jgi:hypothetical protein